MRAVLTGAACAWALSKASAWALEAGRKKSWRAFWWAFGGGMALRALGLAALMLASMKSPQQAALLLSYVFGILAFLMLEYRRMIFVKGKR